MNRRASDETGATPGERGGTGDGAGEMLEQEAGRARDAAREAAGAGRERLEAGAERAAEGVDHLADAVGTAASRLSESEHEGLADHANRLASWLGDMSEKLRSKNVDEIGDDIRRLAERNPALFLLGSVAVGIGLARFAKASREPSRQWDGAAGEARWTGGDAQREGGGMQPDREWTEDVATREFEPAEPSMTTYEGRERGGSERAADRPGTPDSSGGSGL